MAKNNIIQIKDSKTGLYIKINKKTGEVLQKRKYKGAFTGIPIIKATDLKSNTVDIKSIKKHKKIKRVKRVKKHKTIKKIKQVKPVVVKQKKLTVSKIICTRCSTEKKTTKKQMEKLISVFGSIELVHEKYHCIECRRKYNVRKDGRQKPEKKTRKQKTTRLPVMKVSGINNSTCWIKPSDISEKKWVNAIKESVAWAIKNKILIPVRTGVK